MYYYYLHIVEHQMVSQLSQTALAIPPVVMFMFELELVIFSVRNSVWWPVYLPQKQLFWCVGNHILITKI